MTSHPAPPHNLEAITPPWLGFRILFTNDDTVRQGTRIRYRLRIAGIPMSWESRITATRFAPCLLASR